MPPVVLRPGLIRVGAYRVRQDSRSCVISGGAGLRRIFDSGPAFHDVRDGCSRNSPGSWPLADRDFPTGVFLSPSVGAMADTPLALRFAAFLEKHLAGRLLFATCTMAAIAARRGLSQRTDRHLYACTSVLGIVRFLCEAESYLTTEGWLRDRVLGAIVVSSLTPREIACLNEHLEGKLARGGHFWQQEERDGIARTLDWVLLSVHLDLAVFPKFVALEVMCESFREAADFHRGTPTGYSAVRQSQVLLLSRQMHGGAVPTREVVVLGSFAGGLIKSPSAGRGCFSFVGGSLGVGFLACSCRSVFLPGWWTRVMRSLSKKG